ncbi:hypothetical protein GX51_05806 [Blastomyces parvus]|uniref:Yeast cell wall synthesis Kre9/Knh1-like N-terminal domain-containing protein n=1 Tax=Blastomyces parvus TaxID=2060905 RepID=A0A2B7WVC9_9EURO|nr:hypothetical protein GX51_05806 [Blastomyces parvus]
MRSIFYLALSALAAVVAAQSTDNAFNNPPGGFQFAAGKPTKLSWTPTTEGTVTLKLQKGENTTPADGIVIAAGIPNSGTYSYTPPASLGPGSNYNIQIIVDDDPTNYNFTPMFSISGVTGTATGLTPTGTTASPTRSTDSTDSSTATTTGTDSTSSSATTTGTTTGTTTTSSSTSTPSPTNESGNAPDPNMASIARPGFMLTAVLALMAFL